MRATKLVSALDGHGVESIAGETVLVACPTSIDQARAVLEVATEHSLRVVPSGHGTKLGYCRPEVAQGRADLVLSTRRMNAVVEYVAGDGTLTAQAGACMHHLAQTVAAGGHRLSPEIPMAQAATLAVSYTHLTLPTILLV